MVADAESQITERETFSIADEAKNHAELAIRGWQVNLEAAWKLRAIAAFRIAAAQSLDLDTVSLELATGLPQRLGSGTAASHRVLSKGTLVEEDAGMTPPDGQELPLAVYGLERPLLGL